MQIYRSKFEAYPYLCEAADDLRCDFEILTDELTSLTGLLRALVTDEELRQELLWIAELIYHANPSLRTYFSITEEELSRLEASLRRLEKQTSSSGFVLPVGSTAACVAHILRTKSKALVRLLYRNVHAGQETDNALIDFANLLSGYFLRLRSFSIHQTTSRRFRSSPGYIQVSEQPCCEHWKVCLRLMYTVNDWQKYISRGVLF